MLPAEVPGELLCAAELDAALVAHKVGAGAVAVVRVDAQLVTHAEVHPAVPAPVANRTAVIVGI